MKIKFLGAAHEVTGSCTLLTVGKFNILIDCGMEQGPDIFENEPLPISPSLVDCVLLTHAHIDHSGKIPLLVKNGFSGKIYATSATHKLCSIMLLDSAHIQELEASWRAKKAKRSGSDEYVPLYTTEDALSSLSLFSPCEYEEAVKLTDSISIRFIDAGHLLGSSSIEVTATENGITKTILFSGDVGNVDRPLLNNPQKPTSADYVVVESTYGDKVHGERIDYAVQLSKVIEDTFDRGGNVVIPSFAVGRTQELLYVIRLIKENNMVPKYQHFPVYMDSPLALEATKIYDGQLESYYDSETKALLEKGIDPICFNGLRIAASTEESRLINSNDEPKVIISASGMCEAGRIRHHLKHNLWRYDSTILFVGYQSVGTLGRKLVDGADGVQIFGEYIKVNAKIVKIDGISSHADRDMLTDWLGNIEEKPQTVFVNHGDNSVVEDFAAHLSSLGYNAIAPFNGAEFDLLANQCIYEGNSVKKQSSDKNNRRNNAAYERLYALGQRLIGIIESKRNASSKEIAKLSSQISSLCDKYKS